VVVHGVTFSTCWTSPWHMRRTVMLEGINIARFFCFLYEYLSLSPSLSFSIYIYIYPYHFHIDIYIYPLPSDTHWNRLPFQSARTPPVFWQLALRWLWASAKLWPSHWCIRWPRISMKVRTGRDFSGSRTWIDDIYLQYDIYI
jgi:hypothetical protein